VVAVRVVLLVISPALFIMPALVKLLLLFITQDELLVIVPVD
jgi:hypothetical protein